MLNTEAAIASLSSAVCPLDLECVVSSELLVFRVRTRSGRLAIGRSTARLVRLRDQRRGHEFIALTLREELEDRGYRLEPWLPPTAYRLTAS